MEAALSDVVVIDLSRILAGPYSTMILGDLGATVLKIEQPGKGDDTRQFGPPYLGGESAYYLGVNRNKQSITLDFTMPEGKAKLLGLLANATVLVENFRPGTLTPHGLDYASLHELYPGLIYCSISGYGQTGPCAGLPGYDFVAQAESGIMAVTGEAEGEQVRVGTPVGDLSAGMFAATAILAALHYRTRTGKGQYIDLSLLETTMTLLSNVSSNYLITGKEAVRYGNGHPNIVPYQTFPTSDGCVVIASANDRHYRGLCHVLERADLATDARFVNNALRVEHRAELVSELEKAFRQRTTAEWLAKLRAASIPSGPINSVSQAFHAPQIEARGLVWECEHPTAGPIKLVGSPMRFSETPT
ncbi:MAG: CaiB/BaiF CoA transferase family protein, partial [Ktedonobacteraceae bacterium]